MDPQIITQAIDAVHGGQWVVLAGAVLTALVWLARRLLGQKKVPAKAVPLLNAGIGVVLAIADLLMRGTSWYEALATGLLVSASAGGFWSMLGKHVLPLPDSEGKQ